MTRNEIIAAYAAGRRDFTDFDNDDKFLDLSGLVLTDADFSRAFLNVSFDDSIVNRAQFVDANIKTCSFVNADLTEAVFHGAALCATDFSGAVLEGAKFAGACFHGYTFGEDDCPPT